MYRVAGVDVGTRVYVYNVTRGWVRTELLVLMSVHVFMYIT